MANQQEKSSFEDQWKEAFENAEIMPSTGLWKNIDNQLTMQENGKYRKGFVFYRAVAAACIICLLGMGYFVLHSSINSSTNELSKQTHSADQEKITPDEAASESEMALKNDQAWQEEQNTNNENFSDVKPEETDPEPTLAQGETSNHKRQNNANTLKGLALSPQPIPSQRNADQTSGVQYAGNSEDAGTISPSNAPMPEVLAKQFALASISPLGPYIQEEEELSWAQDIKNLYRVPQSVIDKDNEEPQTAFFAGLNLATNYFDPNFSAGSNRSFASGLSPSNDFVESSNLDQGYNTLSSRSTPANSGLENKPKLSLSYGVDVGFMLTKHLSLESGLDYGRMNATTQTSWIAEDFSQGERIPILASNAFTNTAFNNRTQFTPQEQELNNSFSFLSVPLKLGYNLGFDRVKFNLSSGVAANFFLNNRLSDENGQLNTVNISASSNSPYRAVYYSGVVSGGVNYLIASNYALSVSPNYNFSLSALTENGNTFSSQPNAFGVDFGIRYNFR